MVDQPAGEMRTRQNLTVRIPFHIRHLDTKSAEVGNDAVVASVASAKDAP